MYTQDYCFIAHECAKTEDTVTMHIMEIKLLALRASGWDKPLKLPTENFGFTLKINYYYYLTIDAQWLHSSIILYTKYVIVIDSKLFKPKSTFTYFLSCADISQEQNSPFAQI